MRYIIKEDGSLYFDGTPIELKIVDANKISVEHLAPQVIAYKLPKGSTIRVKIQYSSHCWSEAFNSDVHDKNVLNIMDGKRRRIFSGQRFEWSKMLAGLFSSLLDSQLYVTTHERSFGLFKATKRLGDGTHYTAFFKLEKEKGVLNGLRYSLKISVESAYFCSPPSQKQKIKGHIALLRTIQNKGIAVHRK